MVSSEVRLEVRGWDEMWVSLNKEHSLKTEILIYDCWQKGKYSERTPCPVCFRALFYKKDSISRSMNVSVSMLNEES